jgi:curli biogenesis system outer membrane secretion channel CsgG
MKTTKTKIVYIVVLVLMTLTTVSVQAQENVNADSLYLEYKTTIDSLLRQRNSADDSIFSRLMYEVAFNKEKIESALISNQGNKLSKESTAILLGNFKLTNYKMTYCIVNYLAESNRNLQLKQENQRLQEKIRFLESHTKKTKKNNKNH